MKTVTHTADSAVFDAVNTVTHTADAMVILNNLTHTADSMVILNNLTLSSYAMFILLHICFIPLFPFFHFVIPHVLSPSPLNSQWPPSLPFTLPTLPSRHPFHPISPSFSFSC